MRKLFSIFVLIAMFLTICSPTLTLPVEAAGLTTSGYLEYTYSAYTAVITDCDHKAVGFMDIPSTLSDRTVVSIQEYAFQNCSWVTGFSVPDTVTTIGRGAFMSCSDALSITLPAGLTSISESLFWGCSSLTNITMGNQIKQISNYAFSGCSSLKELIIPRGVTTIGEEVFANCSSLETVIIPNTVTTIGRDVFYNCENLSKIIYCGTEAQWNEIYVKGTNTVLKSTDLQYHLPEGGSCTTSPTCAICGEIAGDPLGHSGDWIEIVPVTCVQNGISARICTDCGITESKNIEAMGHQGQWQEIQAPTCVKNGINSRICNICSTTETVILPALGHTNESEVIAPTCTEQGYTSNRCTVCDYEEKTDYVPATDHGWSDWIQVAAPSCNAEGSRIRFCNCGLRETETLAMLAHNYVDGVCTSCGTVMSGYVVLPADVSLTGLCLTEDLYIDLNGFDLSGMIALNGHKVYGMDSTTNEYTCANMGYFNCVDENGNAITPESLYTATDAKRYMAIETESGYTFHRFYLGITKLSLDPSVVGFGYKAEFYADEMVQTQIDAIGYNLWLTEDRVIDRTTAFKNTLTLRLINFDVENYGETPVHACATVTLKDGTVIESATASCSMRQMVERINESYTELDADKLFAVENMIADHVPMQDWLVENVYKKS